MKIANVPVRWATIWAALKHGLPIVWRAAVGVEQATQAHPTADARLAVSLAVADAAMAYAGQQHPAIARVYGAMSRLVSQEMAAAQGKNAAPQKNTHVA